jgi:hypothetical protein
MERTMATDEKKKFSLWKWLGVMLIALPVGIFTAFVAECYWNWFAVPSLHVSELSFLQMLGILWLIQLLIPKPSSNADANRWILLLSVVELCVPEEKQQALADLKEPPPIAGILENFSLIVGQIASNAFMLALGFVLHIFV